MNSVVERETNSSKRASKAALNLNGRDDQIKSGTCPTMNHRRNSAIHFVSAIYWALGTAVVAAFGPYPFSSIVGFRLWVGTGIGLITVDLLAAVKQWRTPASGRVLSVVLHLGVAIFIVSLMTFEYLQARPKSSLAWFREGNYWFVAALALVRLWMGNVVLFAKEETH